MPSTNNARRRRRARNYEASECCDGQLRKYMNKIIGRSPEQKNILSTIFGTAGIVLLCASLVEPKWFKLEGGKCCLEYIGPSLFMSCISKNCWTKSDQLWNDDSCVRKGYTDSTLSDCIQPKSLLLIQVMTILIFAALLTNVLSFILDILAPLKRALWKAAKAYAICYILTVFFCASIVGFAYWSSEDIYNVLREHRHYPGSRVIVSFDLGVYFITASGTCAVLATAANILRVYPTEEDEENDQLLENMGGNDEDSFGNLSGVANSNPPPPYNPAPL